MATSDADSMHYNVEHKVVMDSGGVRVQITRVVKIGHEDGDPTFDFGAEIENLFRAMTGIHDDALGLADNSEPSSDSDSDEQVLDSARNFDIKNDSDKYWMDLIEPSNNNEVDVNSESSEHAESTTTIMKATHRVKMYSANRPRSSLPPKSIFARLAPSSDRYTLLKEEL